MRNTIDINKKKILENKGFIILKNHKNLNIKKFINLCKTLGKPRKIDYLKTHKKYNFINILKI